jgi:NAD(P)H-hydrate repair Nnr-like enzyme with NAD(P)H-hydrate dehydratase domain
MTLNKSTPAMTAGGCGDVLSGVVAALLTKMQDAFSASIAGVYLSGIAGSLAYIFNLSDSIITYKEMFFLIISTISL